MILIVPYELIIENKIVLSVKWYVQVIQINL